MAKAEELRTGRSNAMRKLSRRYAAAEQLTPPPPPAPDLDNEANHTAWPSRSTRSMTVGSARTFPRQAMTTMTPSTLPEHRTVGSQQVDHQARGLVDLTTGDLVVLLACTEDQTQELRPDTIGTDITRQLLRHQHEILTELNHRRNRTTAT